MKFVLSTQELNYLISKIDKIVPQNAPMPILSHFLIEAYQDTITFTATDLLIGIRCSTEAVIKEEGTITLPTRSFAPLVRELTAMNVEISSNTKEVVTIVSGTSRFKVSGKNPKEFPALPNTTESISFSINQPDLKKLLFHTAFAVSKEDNRFVITGAHLQIENGNAIMTGTDGKRLARCHCKIDIDPTISASSIIPLKAVDEILKNLQEEGTAKISIMNDKIAVEANRILIVSKLLVGEYPDVSRIIPEQFSSKISLHREELSSLLRQIVLFTDAQHSVRFAFSNGELKLNSNSTKGEGDVDMPINYKGEKFEIAFNPHFFLDILRHCKEETITINLIDAFNPSIINDGEVLAVPSQASPLFVIMPMRLVEEPPE